MKRLSQEWWFLQWLEDAKDYGAVLDYEIVTTPFELIDPVEEHYTVEKILYKNTPREKVRKIPKRTLILSGTSYTPDFKIIWHPKVKDILFQQVLEYKEGIFFKAQFLKDRWISYVDVKAPPGYGKRNCSDQSLPIMRALMWEKRGVFINRVYYWPLKQLKKPKIYLFPSTFTPTRYLYTDKLGSFTFRKITKFDVVTAQHYFKKHLS